MINAIKPGKRIRYVVSMNVDCVLSYREGIVVSTMNNIVFVKNNVSYNNVLEAVRAEDCKLI